MYWTERTGKWARVGEVEDRREWGRHNVAELEGLPCAIRAPNSRIWMVGPEEIQMLLMGRGCLRRKW